MPALREIFAEYTVIFDRSRALQSGNRAVTRLRTSLQRVRPAIADASSALTIMAAAAGAGAAAGLQQMVSSTVDSTREIERLAGQLSMSSSTLRSWGELAREYGADVEDVADAFKELQLKAQDAIAGGTEQAEMFERIGISVEELSSVVNDHDRLMALFTTRLSRVNDVAMRNFTVDEIMSDSGTRLNQVFALGNEEIQRRRAAIERTIGPTQGLTRAVAEHTRSVIQVSRRWDRFKRELTARILPIVGQLSRKLLEFEQPARRMVRAIMEIIKNTNILSGALVGVGIVAAIAAAATIGTWGPIAAMMIGISAAVAAVAAAYDQVSRTVEGSNTALRKFLDNSALLGEGGTTGLVLALGDAWNRIPGILDEASNGARLLINDFNNLMTQLGAVSEVLQTIWSVVQAIMRRTIAGRVLTAVRGMAQGRAEQEREKQRARSEAYITGRGVEGPTGINPTTGEVVDATGQPMSLDRSQIDVVPMDYDPSEIQVVEFAPGELERLEAADAARRPTETPFRHAFHTPQPAYVPGSEDIRPMSAMERDISVPAIPRSQMLAEAPVTRAAGGAPPQQAVSIDAPMTMSMTIAEATDAQEVERIVGNRVQSEFRSHISQMESLISDQTEVGS